MSYLSAQNAGVLDAVIATDVNLAEVLLSGNNAGSKDLDMNNQNIQNCNSVSNTSAGQLIVNNLGAGGVLIGNATGPTVVKGNTLQIQTGSASSAGTAGQVLTTDGVNASWKYPSWGQLAVPAVGTSLGPLVSQSAFADMSLTELAAGTYMVYWAPILFGAVGTIQQFRVSINGTFYTFAGMGINFCSFSLSIPVVVSSAGTVAISISVYATAGTLVNYSAPSSTLFYQRVA